MITWKCKDCGKTARSADDRERGPLCNGDNKHHPLRMVRADELEARTPPDAGGEIIWRDPPPSMRGRPRTDVKASFIEALKSRPGAWAMWGTPVAKTTSAGAFAKRYPGTEWVTRRRTDGKADLYGRWVGEPEISAA